MSVFISLKNVQIIDIHTYVMTFNPPNLLTSLKIGNVMVTLEKYIPNLQQCYNCQNFRHHESLCTSSPILKQCGLDTFDHAEDICKELKYAICTIKDCRACKREKGESKIYERHIFLRSI